MTGGETFIRLSVGDAIGARLWRARAYAEVFLNFAASSEPPVALPAL